MGYTNLPTSSVFPNAVPIDEIEDVAQHKGVLAAFVEKDLYVTAALWALASNPLSCTHSAGDSKHPEKTVQASYSLVFSGGTSLSKAHGLIERFSEDIDFRLILPPEFEQLSASRRKKRLSDLKEVIERRLEHAGFQRHKPLHYSNANRSQHYFLQYPSQFRKADLPIRAYIRIEIFAASCRRPSQHMRPRSMWHQVTGHNGGVYVYCTDPLEIAAEKLSGLSWRMPHEARGDTEADPNLVRHIHDLAALRQLIGEADDFPVLVRQVLDADRERGARLPYDERLKSLLDLLESDPGGMISKDYHRFVGEMAYTQDPICRSYEQASSEVARLIRRVLKEADVVS